MSTTKERKISKKSVFLIFITLTFILGLLAYRISANFGSPAITADDAPVNVRVAKAELMSIYTTAPISGRVQPIEEVIIMPLASGEVTRVHVSMGDSVQRGAVLFEIDRTQIAATLNQAREVFNSAETAYNRMASLYSEGAVSLQAYEQARTQFVSSRESFNAARSAFNNSTVTSPIAGYVTSLNVTVGSLASPGAPAAVVADVSELKIETSVSEYLAPRMSVGDPVEIRIATLGNKIYEGTITHLSPAPAAGSFTYPVRISVNDESGEVMAGMFAEISIVSDERDHVLCVPSDAVVIRTGRAIVVVLDRDDVAEFREVTTGIDSGEFVEITSGLAPGDTIVVSGQQFAKDGVAVNIVE